MTAESVKSKPRRSYDTSRRRERARRQRAVTLERARELFLHRGYAATTVEAIAEAAGVSAATIYKSHGGKVGLVRDLCAQALAGEGPVPAEQRSDDLRAADDPRSLIEGWGALVAEVSPRVSPLLLVLRAAAAIDPEAEVVYADLDRARLERMAENARHLARRGHLRASVSEAHARDILWLCSSPELYDLLVQQRGWSPGELGAFVVDTMSAMVV